jgi:hypothetical protein
MIHILLMVHIALLLTVMTCHHPQAQPWINLANTYTANGDYGLALVALNVTPMAHETDHKMAEMPEPLRLHNNNEVRGMGPMAMASGSIVAVSCMYLSV